MTTTASPASITALPAARSNGPAKAVIWAFRDYDDRWCVRREGEETETVFASRRQAISFARRLAEAAAGYCLFVQLADGRMCRELCNMGEA